MKSTSRREALGTMMLVGSAFACGQVTVPARAAAPLAIPDGTQRLTRRIERSMRADATLAVERGWHIAFARSGRGIAITGQQVEALVEAPESLAPLAEIEQSRVTDDMWPIMLSDDGRVVAAGSGVREADFAAALDEAERMIGEMDMSASAQEMARQNLAQLYRAGSSLLERLPHDLFYPSLGPQREVRRLDLSGGMTGEFEITYEATPVAESGWLERAERQVVTRVGGSERRARETWTLAPIGV